MVIDKEGNIETVGEITAKKYNVVVDLQNPEATTSASIGQAIIPAGEIKVTIETTAVTDNSKIFTSPRTPTGGQPIIINGIIPEASFSASIERAFEEDIEFDWWVIN